MKKMIRTINHYFFPGENEIHWSNYAWFYGSLGFMGIMLIFALVINMINSWG